MPCLEHVLCVVSVACVVHSVYMAIDPFSHSVNADNRSNIHVVFAHKIGQENANRGFMIWHFCSHEIVSILDFHKILAENRASAQPV